MSTSGRTLDTFISIINQVSPSSISLLVVLLASFLIATNTPISPVAGQSSCDDFGNCTTNVTRFYPQWKARVPNDNDSSTWPTQRHSATYVQAYLDPALVPVTVNSSGNVIIAFSGLHRTWYNDGDVIVELENATVVGHAIWSKRLNDLNLYDIDKNEWISNIPTDGVRPYRRFQSAAVFHDNQLFVFGGSLQGQYLDNSTYVLDFVTLNWTEIVATSSSPSARYGHTAVRYAGNNRMYVFGGYSDLPNKMPTLLPDGSTILYPPPFFNELWMFDLETQTWIGQVPQSGLWPTARTEHSAIVHGDAMYVWGGYVQYQCGEPTNCSIAGPEYFTDLWRFDFLTNTWTQLNTTGTTPTPRAGHSATVDFYDNYMLIFGGRYNNKFLNDIYKFYFASHTWEFVDTNYPACRPRYGHGVFPLPHDVRGRTGDLFLVTSGRLYDFNETNDVGELYTGPASKLPYDPFETGETESAVLKFNTKAPTQAMVPINDCGDREEDMSVDVTFEALQEISYLDSSTVVQKIDFTNSFYEVDLASLYAVDPNVNFELNAGNGVALSLNFTLFGQESTVEFANTSFRVLPSSNKWTFKISNWLFLHPENKLQIKISLALRGNRRFYDIRSHYDRPRNLLSYQLLAEDLDFAVKVATVAKIDDIVTPIEHILRFDPDNAPDANPELFFTFAQFTKSIDYDPDFRVSLGSGAQPDECGFAGWKIALIVLGITIPLLILGVVGGGALAFWLKRKYDARSLGKVQMVEFQIGDRSGGTSPDASSEEDNEL